jgi:hypothetical protein
MMNATNITPSMAAATFSARRRSQPATRRITRVVLVYFSALIFSSIPLGQALASSEAR